MSTRHQFVMQFDTDNAAFEDEGAEIARILRAVASMVEDGYFTGKISDVNGNTVGGYSA
jgi:hypothetical protein